MTDIDSRDAVIAGLKDLATFLEANPEIPVPRQGVTALYFPDRTIDAEMTAEIDQIALRLGSSIDPEDVSYGQYRTGIDFGPVTYEAIAILAAWRAQYEADSSYYGCVVPECTNAA
ncbi:MAG: hypothetical protein JWQ95_6624 [Sphaerisporangium sp.]|nr:hypothetical protein [Sphaerisporangium sp.]